MAFTLDQAELMGSSIESVFYGIYLIIFPISIYILNTRQRDRRGMALTNKLLLIGALLLFGFVTTNWVLEQTRVWTAFITEQDKPLGALLYCARWRDKRNVLRIVFFTLEVATVDSLLVYRMFIVWNCDWRVLVLPALTYCGALVTGIMDGISFANAPPGADLWQLKVSKYTTGSFTCILLTNVLAVVLISGRILVKERQARLLSTHKSSLSWIILSLVESAGILCVFILMVLIAVIMKSAFAFTIYTAASPVTGISFSLITLRVGLSDWLGRLSVPSHTLPTTRRSVSMPKLVHMGRDPDSLVVESNDESMLKDRAVQGTAPALNSV